MERFLGKVDLALLGSCDEGGMLMKGFKVKIP
jgi:hypothetical protein